MNKENSSRPWHREAYVWLLIAIPLAALAASIVTLILAVRGADVEMSHADTAEPNPQARTHQ